MRQSFSSTHQAATPGFNLRREAAPHATFQISTRNSMDFWFQSQTRSRSTCDAFASPVTTGNSRFQSQTRSRSTCDSGILYPSSYLTFVSISDEKPLHMRQPDGHGGFDVHFVSISDEKPLHMRRQLNMDVATAQAVSISDEKPLHMRP